MSLQSFKSVETRNSNLVCSQLLMCIVSYVHPGINALLLPFVYFSVIKIVVVVVVMISLQSQD